MKLAFYKVDNSKNYERHTFDNIYDKPSDIISMLNELEDDEWKLYDISTSGYDSLTPSVSDLVEDYNDEELDGGWWCVLINDNVNIKW